MIPGTEDAKMGEVLCIEADAVPYPHVRAERLREEPRTRRGQDVKPSVSESSTQAFLIAM